MAKKKESSGRREKRFGSVIDDAEVHQRSMVCAPLRARYDWSVPGACTSEGKRRRPRERRNGDGQMS